MTAGLISRVQAALISLVTPLATVAALAPGADAADRIYWASFGGPPGIAYANLDGSGGAALNTAGSSMKEPLGTTIDQVGGRIYWADHTAGKISYASLDGTGGGDLNTAGATTSGPIGVAVDPVARRIYWANESGKISYASLDGSGGADLNTSGATPKSPAGVALDPAAGRIYWTNFGGDSISYANLDGSGGADLTISGATVKYPLGLAIDPAAGRIYWANDDPPYQISSANLNGSGGSDLNTAGATSLGPYGVALDPLAGRIYWGNTGAATISYANLSGSGGADLPIDPSVTKGAPNFPTLLETPRGTGVPSIGGGAKVGSTLTCSQGSWAADVVSAFLYRAPLGYAHGWQRNGTPIAGASGSSFAPSSVGLYRCEVTATNRAGASAQASATVGVFKLGKLKRNKRRGTARLTVTVPGSGRLTLAGKGLVASKRTAKAAGNVKIPVAAKGKKRKGLRRRGKIKVRPTLTFTPSGGQPGSQGRPITLRKKLH